MSLRVFDPNRKYPWASTFIELALRDIRRVHHNYGLWSLGHPWLNRNCNPTLLNIGPGIELADELTVCASITQEFINSQLSSGAWIPENLESDVEAGPRFFRIDREKLYMDGRKRVDICLERHFLDQGSGKTHIADPPVYIEAKRARRWQSEISTGEVRASKLNLTKIREDIEKLRNEARELKSNEKEIYTHLLVWNVFKKKSDSPTAVFRKINDHNLFIHQLKWLPLSWTSLSLEKSENKAIMQPEVNKSLWIALAEVDNVT